MKRRADWSPPEGFLQQHTREPPPGTHDASRKVTCKHCEMTLFKGQRLRAHFTKLSVGKGARPCMSSSAESAMLELMEQEEKESASKQLRLTYFISDEERINKLQVEAFADNRIMLHVASSPSFRSYIDAVARSGKPSRPSVETKAVGTGPRSSGRGTTTVEPPVAIGRGDRHTLRRRMDQQRWQGMGLYHVLLGGA